MTGQAAASPLTALLTQWLSPIVGFAGMFVIIACFSFLCTVLTVSFPRFPSARSIKDRLVAPPSQL